VAELAWRPTPLLLASAGVHAAALSSLAISRSWEAPLAAVVANHLVIAAACMSPRSGWLGPNMTRIPSDRVHNQIALTFDDGPDPVVTPKVLDLLEQAGSRATFFCLGERAAQHADLIGMIRDRGHGVENHTQRHPNTFALRGAGAMRREVLQAQDSIEQTAGRRPRFFRAPAGMQNPWLFPILAAAGLSLVSWTRRGFDTASASSATVASRLTRGLAAGDILLLHDGYASTRTRDPGVVIDALARVLEAMQKLELRSEAMHRLLPAEAGPRSR
jgi:peptidoglycan/xylan/chitin deacetylase (PgdA/CDA1 family)